MAKQPPKAAATPAKAAQQSTTTVSNGLYGNPLGSNKGRNTSAFLEQRGDKQHKGIDIAVPRNTPIYATQDGVVTYSGVASGYGNVIYIRHPDGRETRYAHLNSMSVTKGQTVAKGQQIGLSGNTGRSSGPHLHYEVRQNGVAINPNSVSEGGSVTGSSTPTSGAVVPPAGSATPASGDASAEAARARLSGEEINRRAVLDYNQDDIIAKLSSGEHFKPNAASDFYNLTYHWRLFMTADTEIITAEMTQSESVEDFYNRLNSFEQVTIAESGVTTYSIDEVTMDAAVGTDFRTESSMFQSIEMKITEPNGVNFLDSLRNAALSLGIRNYHKCFYYLELTFKGYDETGEPNLAPFDGIVPNGGHWVFTTVITDLEVNLTASGGTYVLKMTPLADSIQTTPYNTVPSLINPTGSTVGEFMESLCEKLNSIWKHLKADDGIVKYNVVFHDVPDLLTAEEVKGLSLVPKELELSPMEGFSFAAEGSPTATIQQGFTISQTIDAMMSACEQAQALAVDVLDVANGDTGGNGEGAQMHRQSIMWRLETEMHSPDYDPVFNEYYRHITLHVYGFRNHATVLRPQITTSSVEAQKAILADIAKRDFLPKKYEFLYSATNTEVIDLDLNFNLSWSAILPSVATTTYAQAGAHAKVDSEAKKDPTVVPEGASRSQPAVDPKKQTGDQAASPAASGGSPIATAMQAVQNVSTAVTNEFKPPSAAATPAEIQEEAIKTSANQQSAASQTVGLQEELIALDAERTAKKKDGTWSEADEAKFAQKQKEFNDSRAVSSQYNKKLSAQRAALKAKRPASTPMTGFGRSWGEDLTLHSEEYAQSNALYSETFPISIQSHLATPNSGGTEGQYHAGRSAYGAIRAQAYGPMAKQFQTITLTIKGDPFWIGSGSYEQAIWRKTDMRDENYFPKFSTGAICFLLRIRYPMGQDENGDVILLNNESVTGCYQVNRVQHRFVNGQFTQVLTAVRIPLINLYSTLYNSLYTDSTTSSAKDTIDE